MNRLRKLSYSPRWVLVGLLLLTMWVYFPPYHASFVGDDYVQLDYIAPYVERPFSALALLNPFTLPWYYRPIQNWWFLFNRLVFGLNPFGYYAFLLGLHLLAVALVYRVARQLQIRPFAALIATTLFAIHGHHLDVVAWISSMAIVSGVVFTLAAVSAFLSWLHHHNRKHLGLALLFYFLSLITHEEGFLLPPLLVWLHMLHTARRTQPKRRKKGKMAEKRFWQGWQWPVSGEETAVFLIMAISVIGYLVIQFTRPNLTISVGDTPANQYLTYLSPYRFSLYVVEFFVRYTLTFNWLDFLLRYSIAWSYLLLLAGAIWFWYGGRTVKFGLTWLALHAAFIYWALWSQKPELFAGRHLYNASVGLVWALGWVIDAWLKRPFSPPALSPNRQRAILLLVLIPLLWTHIRITRNTQLGWLADTQEDARVEAQMKAILPSVNDKTHIFANRFVMKPTFLPAVARVWYNYPLPNPAGAIETLKKHGRADRNYYVFDYDGETLYNLMPELQAHDETIFLWSQTPNAELIAPDGTTSSASSELFTESIVSGSRGAQRLSVLAEPPPGSWLSLGYTVNIPEGAALATAIRVKGESGSADFRIRLMKTDGTMETVFMAEGVKAGEWQEVVLPMAAYWGQSVVVRLETAVSQPGIKTYWANPRLIIDR